MSHSVRWLPGDRPLVEVSNRTIQARYLLCPTEDVRDLILGILGRAQRMFAMDICMFTFMSNHYHMLLAPKDAHQLAKFMGYVGGEIGREISRLARWGTKVWAGRYSMAVISDEEAAQVGRLRYLLAHGVKEGLVDHPADWPGAHGVGALLYGDRLQGHWFDRGRESLARRRGKPFQRLDFAKTQEVVLSPLPCWRARNLDSRAIRRRVVDLVRNILEMHRLSRLLRARWKARERRPGARTRGKLARTNAVEPSTASDRLRRLLDRPREYRPAHPKSSPHRPFLAATTRARRRFYEAHRHFLAAYRQASERWRAGDLEARFPAGCFPPAPPFVGTEPRPEAGLSRRVGPRQE